MTDGSFEKACRAKHGHGPMEGLPPAEPKPKVPRKPPPQPPVLRDPTQERKSKLPSAAPVTEADLQEVREGEAADPLSPFAGMPVDTSKGIVDNDENSPNRSKEEMKMEQSTTPAATQPPKIQRASRRRGKLRILAMGPSGSGKTYSALLLASGIGGNWCVVDTENESAADYAADDDATTAARGKWIFGHIVIRQPYTVEKYLKAFADVIAAGYDGVVFDSISHAWSGEGGLLNQKEALDRRGGNAFTNWANITKLQEKFKAMILQSPIHLIATVRSKQEHVIEKDSNGRTTVRKVGMKAEQRSGIEYEFQVAFDFGIDHAATVSKDRTGMFPDSLTPIEINEAVGKQLIDWRMKGKEYDGSVAVAEAPLELQVDDEPPPVAQPEPQPASAQPAPTNGNGDTAEAMRRCKKAGTSFSAEVLKEHGGKVTPEVVQAVIKKYPA